MAAGGRVGRQAQLQRQGHAVQRGGGVFNGGGQLPAQPLGRRIVAQQVQVELAAQQRVAQVDGQQQHRDAARHVGRIGPVGGLEQQVARGLQPLVQAHLPLHPVLQRRRAFGAHAVLQQQHRA